MSTIAINPSVPLVAVQGVTADVILQPGTVISAQVQQILGNDQVQISIGGQSIVVVSQVPLQAGQTLQLSVSQAPDGSIQLAVVNVALSAAGQAIADLAGASLTADLVVLTQGAIANLAAPAIAGAVVAPNQLTPPEAVAVTAAAQAAATQQTSLAPLFANLSVAAGVNGLPAQVQQAVAQVLAQRISLDPGLTGAGIKQAFQSSGLFLEASLASGSVASSAAPDLKAALIVLRQALTTSLADVTTSANVAAPALSSASQPGTPPAAAPAEETTPSAATPSDPAATGSISVRASVSVVQQATTPALTASVPAEQAAVESSAIVATILAEAESPGQVLEGLVGTASLVPATATAAASTQPVAQATLAEIAELVAGSQSLAAAAVPGDAARTAASGVALSLLQEVLQASPLAVTNPSQFVSENSQALALLPLVAGVRTADDAEFARTNLPPPPINGALPSSQPVASATLSAHMPPNTALQHLLDDTDGAIARQTLLQIASLPGQADASASRVDASAPRWNFEIPFATPQGTAMAQFEISRDGGGREATAAKATWRARFSLNVEPAGPVHALVSLNGDRTSVRMWAERPSTASQLRAGVSQLSQALSRAELKPGDIVIRDGAPSQSAAASAGHFLDRAS
jgi:Flagellar hook-length control protein FliK